MVGYCYYNGEGTEEDEKLALEWLNKSANQGNTDAKEFLDKVKFVDSETLDYDTNDEKLNELIKKAKKIVLTNVTASFATGAIPIPFADALVLVPIQVSMIIEITSVFNIKISKSVASALVGSALGSGGATIIGKTLITILFKLIPGLGSVVGGAISGAVAGALTTAMGMAYIELMIKVYTGELETEELKSKKAKEILKNNFKEKFKEEFAKNKDENKDIAEV